MHPLHNVTHMAEASKAGYRGIMVQKDVVRYNMQNQLVGMYATGNVQRVVRTRVLQLHTAALSLKCSKDLTLRA